MTDSDKLLKVTNINGSQQLYVNGLTVVSNPSCVVIDGALYIVRDGNVVLSTGKKSILQLVQSGKQVYLQS